MKTFSNVFGGYMGKIAFVDLSRSEAKLRDVSPSDLRLFIGGSGLASKIIYDNVPPNIDPFDPDNIIAIMTGPMTGTIFPTSGRFAVCSKSPLTDGWGEARASGFWGPELKFSGLDGIVVTGRSEKPVYIYVEDLNVNIVKADHLWGKGALEVEEMIRRDHGDRRIKVLSIGPAGENIVRFAGLICDGGRAAARCGLGAVMGSKRLKAIAVRGERSIEVADPERLLRVAREVSEIVSKSPGAQGLRKYGTAGLVEVVEVLGDLPVKYWSMGSWPEGARRISGQTMAKTMLKGVKACFTCPIACSRLIEVGEGPYAPLYGKGPEYETIAALGSLCLIDSLEAIAEANYLCNNYGLDTISTGNVIAFAIEAFERGYITEEDTGGLKLRWGDPDTMLTLIDMIARREGVGDILAEGVKRAAEKIGAEDLAVHVRGLEVPMHDPRAFSSLALQYATMPRGACHTAFAYVLERSLRIPELGFTEIMDRFSIENKAHAVKVMQDFTELFDALALCKFLLLAGVSPSLIVEGLSATTGWNTSLEELLTIGERIFNLKRAFNVRCGTGSSKFDTLPSKLLEPLPDGGAKGFVPDLRKMLPEYYKLRGWSADGIPLREKLVELELHDAARDIWG